MQKIYLWSVREWLIYFILFSLAAVWVALSTSSPIAGLITLLLHFPWFFWFGVHVVKMSGNQISFNSWLASLLGIKPKFLDLNGTFDLLLVGMSSIEPLLEGILLAIFPAAMQVSIVDRDHRTLYVLSRVHMRKLLPMLYPVLRNQPLDTAGDSRSLKAALRKGFRRDITLCY